MEWELAEAMQGCGVNEHDDDEALIRKYAHVYRAASSPTEVGVRERWMAYADVMGVSAITEEEEDSGAFGNVILNDYMNCLEDPDSDMCACDFDDNPHCESCERWRRRRRAILATYIRCVLGKQ